MKKSNWILVASAACLLGFQGCSDEQIIVDIEQDLSLCGNGALDTGEKCDDGNDQSGDGCSSNCRVENGWKCEQVGEACTKVESKVECGNGKVESGEECDDGNAVDGDGCSSECKLESEDAFCGDAVVNPGEECDDGNAVDGDGCSSECKLESEDAVCGNGKVESGEECDDGNAVDGDGCSSDCKLESEDAFCGDGVVDVGEQCDDGNAVDGDGCSSDCKLESEDAFCGDGVVNPGEECDDGNTFDGDGCSSMCKKETAASVCGNGKVETGEECDDGNAVSGDGCSSKCKREAVCGNGKVETGEECDDGNAKDGDGCSSKCKKETPAVCGNGKLESGEQCDDGNAKSGDGCSSKCVIEESYICTTAGAACKPEFDQKTSIRILGIGNSFMRDATCYLYDILKDMGYTDVVVGVLYTGGKSINWHYANYTSGNKVDRFFYDKDGSYQALKDYAYVDAMKKEKWDYLVLQQYPSGIIDSYNKDIDDMISVVKKYAPTVSKVYWSMTWGFQLGSPHFQMPLHGHDQMKMYQATTNAVQNKILTNKNDIEVIPVGTVIQNLRTGILGDNVNRDGYHMSMNSGRYAAALMWAKQITKRPVSKVKFNPAGHTNYADMKLNFSYTDRQLSSIKQAVVDAYKKPYDVTFQSKGVLADYSAQKKDLQKIFTDNGYDLSKYHELNFGATEYAYYNPTARYDAICTLVSNHPAVTEDGKDVKYCYSTMVAEENGGTSETLRKYAATKIFTRYEIPEGSVIVLRSGYQYIPDGWTDLKKGVTKENRPATVKEQIVKVDSKWWGSFKYRAFSITKTGATTMTADEVAKLPAAMTIYVPNHLDGGDNADDAMKNAGYDLSQYKKLDLELTYGAYWQTSKASDLQGGLVIPGSSSVFPSKLFSGNGTAAHYAASKIFKKSEIPNGSLIVAVKGTRYYPDAWVALDKPNLNDTRPTALNATDKDMIVKVDDKWWGDFQYRGFDISKTGVASDYAMTPLEMRTLGDKFAVYVPIK